MLRYWSFAIALALGSFVGCQCNPNIKITLPEKPADETIKSVVEADNQFACDLFREVSKQEGNIVLSPASISTTLGMAYPGAAGNTATQMKATLHWGNADDHHAVHSYQLGAWMNATAQGDYQLRMANALWGQQGKTWKADFLKVPQEKYWAGFHQVDFAKPDDARGKINTWVAEQTEKKIAQLLPEGSLTDLTKLVLTNAVYFQSDWAYAFQKEGTIEDERFYTAPGEFVKVPMMYQTHEFNYGGADRVSLVELPYKGNKLSMIVALPNQLGDLAKIEQSLTADKVNQWVATMKKTKVNVGLPRFRFGTHINLNQALQTLGMKDAFTEGVADFSNMDGTKDLFISKVFHQGLIEVNEAGTEAAGASGIVLTPKGGDAPQVPPQIHANQPFLFVIRDVEHGNILFIGRVANPK